MDFSISNHQEALAELVVINDIQNNFTSYEAILSIKRWKFITRIPGIAMRVKKQADQNIQQHFLTYISNKNILSNEGFLLSNTSN